MRSIILSSITISQIGFVCAGTIITAENMVFFLEAVRTASSPLSSKAFIGLQLILLIPLAFVCNLSKLGGAALLADVLILLGLGCIYYFDISTIAAQNVNMTVQLFNPQDFTLTVGSSIFTFEGIADKKYFKIGDILLLSVGFIAMVYTTIVTVVRGSGS